MNLPGFTAPASLYQAYATYRVGGRPPSPAAIATDVLWPTPVFPLGGGVPPPGMLPPQLTIIGFPQFEFCNGELVNVLENDTNCGACNVSVGPNQACCGGQPVPASDNCGGCGPFFACPPSQNCCEIDGSRQCVSWFDPFHCRVCNNECGAIFLPEPQGSFMAVATFPSWGRTRAN